MLSIPMNLSYVYRNMSVADPIFFYPWIRDTGWKKIRIRDEHPGSYFRGLRTIFLGFKILIFFDADPRSGIEKFGSGINIPDPQQCVIKIENGKVIFNVISICRKNHLIRVFRYIHTRYHSKTLYFHKKFHTYIQVSFWGKSGK
jgi:hypothetical protein